MNSFLTHFKKALKADKAAISKILTLIEEGEKEDALLKKIYSSDSEIHTIALTGPPGVGKSSLIAQMVEPLATHQSLGIIAMDPRSWISNGAFLGDRIRLAQNTHHPRIFFRSFAPHGLPMTGYLTAKLMARAFGAFGFGCALIETIGTGQAEWGIHELADTTILVLSPESGDEIQMMKRGLIEWADIFVINKMDRPGAKQLELALHRELHHRKSLSTWKPPVLLTAAQSGEGIEKLLETIEKHHHFLKISDEAQHNQWNKKKLECMLWALSITSHQLNKSLKKIKEEPDMNPYEEAKKLLKEMPHGRG